MKTAYEHPTVVRQPASKMPGNVVRTENTSGEMSANTTPAAPFQENRGNLVNRSSQDSVRVASIQYRGHTFPGYNKPIKSSRPEKKKMVLAKKGDKVKIVHFGQRGYKHNYSAKAKASYLARSAGIKGKGGKSTKDDKFSANYWARRVLWPRGKADGSAKKTAAEIYSSLGGLAALEEFGLKLAASRKPETPATNEFSFVNKHDRHPFGNYPDAGTGYATSGAQYGADTRK